MQIFSRNDINCVIYETSRKNLVCAKLSFLLLKNANFESKNLQGAVFSNSDLAGASFANADLYGTTFFQANLSDADLTGTNLRGSDLKFAKLVGADLSNADLSSDNLRGPTQLESADLSEAIIFQTKFIGATYNSNTIFPDSFSPKHHRMKMVSNT